MFDHTSELHVADSDGFRKGARIRIESGTGKGETLVIKSIDSPTAITIRPYYWFDRAYDWLSLTWQEIKFKMDVLIEAKKEIEDDDA